MEPLFSLKEVAEFCGRNYSVLKLYYTFPDFLPDPENTTITEKGRKIRRFTLEEAKELKKILDSVSYGDLAKYTSEIRGRYK